MSVTENLPVVAAVVVKDNVATFMSSGRTAMYAVRVDFVASNVTALSAKERAMLLVPAAVSSSQRSSFSAPTLAGMLLSTNFMMLFLIVSVILLRFVTSVAERYRLSFMWSALLSALCVWLMALYVGVPSVWLI